MAFLSMKHDIRMIRKEMTGIPTLCTAVLAMVSLEVSANAEATLPVHPVNAFLRVHYVEMLALIPVLILLGLMAYIVRIDPYIQAGYKRTMRIIIVAVFSLVAQNYLEYRLAMGEVIWLARTLTAIYGYAIRPVILILFIRLICPEKSLGWAWALAGVNAAIYTTALFSNICFWIAPTNNYQGGPLSNLCLWVSAILMSYFIYLTIHIFHPRRQRETWVPVFVVLLIAGGVALDVNMGYIPQPIAWLTITVMISCVFYYIWLHLQFVRKHEDALRAGQRVQLMLSQIQPHFLFNTMEVIRRMCRKNPSDAEDAIVKLERYLRGNMDSMAREGLVTFDSELTHARLYLELEQMRFPGELHAVYDLSVTEFMLPSLTLQPLVENAVRHGVRGKKSGEGTVTIATREYPDRYVVAIADDGPGFDPNALKQDGQMHIGIANIRERLGYAGANLSIASQPEKGTVATIIVPKTKTEENEHADIRAGR